MANNIDQVMLFIEGMTVEDATKFVMSHPKEMAPVLAMADMLHALVCTRNHKGDNCCGYYHGTLEEKALVIETYVIQVLKDMLEFNVKPTEYRIVISDVGDVLRAVEVYKTLGRTTTLPLYLKLLNRLLLTLDTNQ